METEALSSSAVDDIVAGGFSKQALTDKTVVILSSLIKIGTIVLISCPDSSHFLSRDRSPFQESRR